MLKNLFESTPPPQDDHDPDPVPQDDDAAPAADEIVDLPPAAVEDSALHQPEEEEGTPGDLPVDVPAPAPSQAEDIESVRALILELHPTIVPELINGDSVSALIASIVPAQEAYNRIVATIPDVRIPAGGNSSVATDAESLTTFEMIRRGLTESRPAASRRVHAANSQRKA